VDEHAARDGSPAPVAVEPWRDSSPERFESFYLREFRKVVALTYALSGSGLAAEDLAQEAFLAASQRWEVIGRYERPEAWVRRVAANMARRTVRRRFTEARVLARAALGRGGQPGQVRELPTTPPGSGRPSAACPGGRRRWWFCTTWPARRWPRSRLPSGWPKEPSRPT
jgi:Sigma-70 region 2